MAVLVSGVGALIHIYSLGYCGTHEANLPLLRGAALFMFAMFGIVFANNFVMLFIFSGIGRVHVVCFDRSLVLSRRRSRRSEQSIHQQQIGNFGFIWHSDDLKRHRFSRVCRSRPANADVRQPCNVCRNCRALNFLRCSRKICAVSVARLAAGRDGRSDASLCANPCGNDGCSRCLYALPSILLAQRPGVFALEVIGWVGAATALLAALIAVQQNDIKRILAYSTLSQLGLMVMAVGAHAPVAGMFHFNDPCVF